MRRYKGQVMYRFIFLPLIFLVSSCDSDKNKEAEPRDLNDSISFTELVEKRMQMDSTVDGEIVLITSEVNTHFIDDCHLINPALPIECTNDVYVTEVIEPSYSGTSVGSCSVGVALTNQDVSELLHINITEDSEFFSLGNQYNIPVNFYAKVEFVERKVSCSDQVNYGITITLQDGEEEHLLEQLR